METHRSSRWRTMAWWLICSRHYPNSATCWTEPDWLAAEDTNMTTYVAPTRDMLFARNELAGLAEIAAMPGNGEVTTDLVEAILDEAAKFATEVLAPINAQGDRQGCRCKDGQVTTAD